MKFKNLSTISAFFLASLLVMPFFSCSDDDSDSTPQEQTIAEIAAGDDQFSILVSALEKVNLVAVLNGTDNYTVFAPTNAAFQAAGIDLDAIPDEVLTEVLLYHVLGGEVTSGAIEEGQSYPSTAAATGPNGTNLSILIEKSASGVKINNEANVTTADIDASNGVIHVIDKVLTPFDIVDHAAANSNFSTLVGALTTASGDLVTVLSGDGPFTVFAPVNSAFEEISGVVAGLDADQLSKVLTYHVVGSGNILASDLTDGLEVTTVNGEKFTVNINGANVTLTDANGNVSNVVRTDVQATNGVIHVLDKVIIPANL